MDEQGQVYAALLFITERCISMGNKGANAHHLGLKVLHEAHIRRQGFRALTRSTHHNAASGLEADFLQVFQATQTIG